MEDGRALLARLSATPDEALAKGLPMNRDGRRRTAFALLAFPDMTVERMRALWPELAGLAPSIATQLEIDARYDIYLRRQDADIEAYRKDEAVAIPSGLDYRAIAGLSTELRQKLEQARPASLAQAARIDGMTPAALMLLLANVKKAPWRRSA
jgi:tRNA uridine 5-carboxymethylaminomethyl modification enzyme